MNPALQAECDAAFEAEHKDIPLLIAKMGRDDALILWRLSWSRARTSLFESMQAERSK